MERDANRKARDAIRRQQETAPLGRFFTMSTSP